MYKKEMLLKLQQTILLGLSSAVFWLPYGVFGYELPLGGAGVLPYERMETMGGLTHYFRGDVRVATVQDVDLDGDEDVWLVYKHTVPVLEIHDTNDDGVPDTFFTLASAPHAGVVGATTSEVSSDSFSCGRLIGMLVGGVLLGGVYYLGYWHGRMFP